MSTTMTAELDIRVLSADKVREHLLAVWLEQACSRPAHRKEVRERLLLRWGARVEEAVARLVDTFRDGIPTEDPAGEVWRAFPMLDREHCARLATMLMAAS
jgi:hypothetical protein